VIIPAIGVNSSLVDLHLNTAGVLVPPTSYTVAGWYAAGPAPGQPGPAVIAGHIDSTSGPAVFYRLSDLRAGDEVDVDLSDGTVARFTVNAVQQYSKGAFPTAAVYGPVPGSALRLITCGGSFDYSVHSYRDNTVVYATEM
jgi:sortase (surface protein transpeptidase)